MCSIPWFWLSSTVPPGKFQGTYSQYVESCGLSWDGGSLVGDKGLSGAVWRVWTFQSAGAAWPFTLKNIRIVTKYNIYWGLQTIHYQRSFKTLSLLVPISIQLFYVQCTAILAHSVVVWQRRPLWKQTSSDVFSFDLNIAGSGVWFLPGQVMHVRLCCWTLLSSLIQPLFRERTLSFEGKVRSLWSKFREVITSVC